MKAVEDLNVQTQIMATASKFQTKGAASQYKFVATMQAKVKSAMLKLDAALLSLPTPEGATYEEICAATEGLKAVVVDCGDRIGQFHRADLDPKFGFKAMTQLDMEEELLAVSSNKITKYKKLLRQLKAEDQKESSKKSDKRFTAQPFRARPDFKSGFRQSFSRRSSPGTQGTKKI